MEVHVIKIKKAFADSLRE